MSDLIDRKMAITHVNAVLFPKINTAMEVEKALRELPTIEEHRDEAWEMFSLITSVWYGKQYYFMQDNGLVYSRKSHLTMTKGDALDEFLKEIESDA